MRLILFVCLVATSMTTPAMAWKPTTHAYLTAVATRDALDDGLISISNLVTGKVMSYPVDAQAYYHAGVLGPIAPPTIKF